MRKRGVPEDVIHCLQSHAPYTGVPREKPVDKAFFAVDELAGLITACALVRPSKSLHDLTSTSVRGKWQDRTFAASVNREEIELGAQELLTLDRTMSHARKWTACEQLVAINKRMNGESAAWLS